MRPIRLAYLVTHPIQYQAPLLARLAAEPWLELEVLFESDISVRAYRDPGFGRDIEWDVPLLDGYRHRFLPMVAGRGQLTSLLPVNRGIARALARGRFDALWVHGYARPQHLWAMAAAKARGMTVLLRDETTAVSRTRGPARRAAKAATFAVLRRLVDRWLAIGRLNADYYRSLGVQADRIFPVPYAVDNERFMAMADRADRPALRAALGLSPDRPVVLFAGKLIARKRAGDLVAAFRRLAPAAAACRPYLLIAGDGPERGALEGALAPAERDDVRFLGFRRQTELPALYALADVFAIPSEAEPWGLVVNEAMCAATAIVASDGVGAAADLVREGANGRIHPAGDVPALAGALSAIFAEPGAAARMGAESRRIMAGWDYAADVAGLRSALDGSGGRPS
ncbi:MAG: glycosyltransferase family 4 protein [Alphaproteobacteria bacterium]